MPRFSRYLQPAKGFFAPACARHARQAFRRAAMVLIAFAAGAAFVRAQPPRIDVDKEYTVKVLFLYQFGQHIDWPNNAFAAKDSPFVIGVYGNASVGAKLNLIALRRKLKGRPIVVKRITEDVDPRDFHMIFVSKTTTPEQRKKLHAKTKNSPLLLVGETPDYASQGGHIGFFLDSDATVGYEVNRESMRRRSLTPDKEILETGREVNSEEG